MTREQVLAGVKFRWEDGSTYAAQPDKNGIEHGGSLLLCVGKARIYECNVYDFGPNAMRWFTFIMGKKVTGRIRYDSLEAA